MVDGKALMSFVAAEADTGYYSCYRAAQAFRAVIKGPMGLIQ